MKGDPGIIRLLNVVLTNELTSINQYFLHARMFRHWGFYALAKVIYDEFIGEMRHADRLTERILFLDGLPNLQDLHKLRIGETVPEALAADLNLERSGRAAQLEVIRACEAKEDYVSREVVVRILEDTEEHIDYLETQLALIKALGEANYLQSAMGEMKSGGEAE